jgi:hypothetical protein
LNEVDQRKRHWKLRKEGDEVVNVFVVSFPYAEKKLRGGRGSWLPANQIGGMDSRTALPPSGVDPLSALTCLDSRWTPENRGLCMFRIIMTLFARKVSLWQESRHPF